MTRKLSMFCFAEVEANIVGTWPLIVSYLKKTGRKTDGESCGIVYFVASSSVFGSVTHGGFC